MIRPQMAGRKFSTSTSTAISLSVVAFILLSACSYLGEARQCYWCGPLAEQVHRSRRAPPCDAPNVTTCDEGLPYCAVVAVAPPYTESRYCVKIYQDECYLDFCNTTSTWKMTCPCKGDLCNGQNSNREETAFAELAHLAQKHLKKRTKKSIKEPLVKNKAKPIQTEDKKQAMVDNSEPPIEVHNINKTSVNDNDFVTEIHVYENTESASMKPTGDDEQKSDEKATTKTHEEVTTHATSGVENDVTILTTLPLMQSTAIQMADVVKPLSGNLVKPSEELPTGEALQSSDNSDEKKESQSTLADDLMKTTVEVSETTTETPMLRKSLGVNIRTNSLVLILSILTTYTFKP